MSQTAPQYDNPATAQKLREEVQRQEAEDRANVAQDLSVKQKLERSREEKKETFEIQIDGVPVEFEQPTTNLQERALTINAKFEGMNIEDDLDSQTTAELVGFMKGAMDQMSVSEDLDEDFWGDYDAQSLESHFESVMMSEHVQEGEEDLDPKEAEEIDGFRST